MSVKFPPKVLLPGWIVTFGLVSLIAPPLGVAASLWLFMIGVFVVPALVLVPAIAFSRAPGITLNQIRRAIARLRPLVE